MFIKNETPLLVALTRGFISETELAVAVVCRDRYAIQPNGLLSLPSPTVADIDLPSIFKAPLWHGTSVTVSGKVRCPQSPPYQVPVELRVGAASRRLLVFGDRRWRLTATGALSASAPERFEEMELSFERAYGGSYVVAPGLDRATGLPDPGGRIAFLLNPIGTGFYASDEAAVSRPLPNIEDPDHLIRAWDDRPVPVGISACAEHHALRLQFFGAGRSDDDMLRFQHEAPPELIFDHLENGSEIQVSGVGPAPLRFQVPSFSALVSTAPYPTMPTWRLRAIAIDMEAAEVDVTHGAEFVCEVDRLPRWIAVTRLKEAA